MTESSIATPSAGPWGTNFPNAAYFAPGEHERDLDDLRLAQRILATRWARQASRRLGARDLPAFQLAAVSAARRLPR